MKPTQILAKLCKDGKLDGPHYGPGGRVKVENRVFMAPTEIEDENGEWSPHRREKRQIFLPFLIAIFIAQVWRRGQMNIWLWLCWSTGRKSHGSAANSSRNMWRPDHCSTQTNRELNKSATHWTPADAILSELRKNTLRPLSFNSTQGRIEMWVDMFPKDMTAPGPALDISPRKPKKCV